MTCINNVCSKRKPLSTFLLHLRDYRYLLLMLVPAVAYFIFFHYAPMYGLVVAFKKFDYSLGIISSPWNGLDNFQFLFKSGKLVTLFSNTMLYNLAFIIVGTVFQIALSIIMSEMKGKIYKKICQTCLFLPYFISWVVVGAVMYNLCNYKFGFINSTIRLLGGEAINMYVDASIWPYILVAVNVWKGVGYGTVVYLAAIAGIDQEIYEAAQIDGASVLKRIRHITLPNLVPTVVTLTLLNIGSIFRGNFELFWNVIGKNNLLYKTTDVIDTYVYRSLLDGTNFGMTAASGLLQSVLCFAMITLVNAIIKRISPENALY